MSHLALRITALVVAATVATSGAACDDEGDDDDPSKPGETDESANRDGPDTESAGADPPKLLPADVRWRANDAHTHLGPNSYPIVEKVLSENDIYRVINLSGGHSADYRRKHLERTNALPNRIALFLNVDWDDVDDQEFGERMAQKLQRAVDQGFAGLKISKSLGLGVKTGDGDYLPVDTPKLDPLWAKAGELGVPVTIHTGDPKAFFEKPGPENERYAELEEAPDWSHYDEGKPERSELLAQRDRMIARHPETTFILAHMANNPEDIDYVADLLAKHDNLYVDTSARIAEFGRHPAERMRKFFIRFQDRILFGTDIGIRAKPTDGGLRYSLFLGSVRRDNPTLEDVGPFFDKHWRYFESDDDEIPHPIPIQGDWKVHPIDLPKRVRAKVYWYNAERLVFSPWLGRRSARQTIDRARDLATSE